ncbi:MAG TPA: NAD(P)H-dependent oxidoreductase [Armatimonadota bacterium]|jgi:multimeric flavodoxin WrbA/putative sterol carrier protein
MKILVLNGSPRGRRGNTEILAQAFLEGAREAGAQAETVYLSEKTVQHCNGCFTCWVKTPGVCVHQDDMAEVLQQMLQADVLVYASPLYIYTVTGLMKDCLDRSLPLAQPFIDVEDGLCIHPPRYGDIGNKSVVLISNSGFPEQGHFSGLKETFRRCYRSETKQLAGMICCAGGVMLEDAKMREAFTWYLDAVRQAGREVVTQRKLTAETQATLERPLIEDQVMYANMANAHWRSLGLSRITPDTARVPVATPAPTATPLAPPAGMESMADLISGMALIFNAEAAGDLCAVLQFVVPDETPGQYYLNIAQGQCTAYAGTHPAPTATITTPAHVWLDIARGKLNGAAAFMTGKYKVTGDMLILMQFEKLFPVPKG